MTTEMAEDRTHWHVMIQAGTLRIVEADRFYKHSIDLSVRYFATPTLVNGVLDTEQRGSVAVLHLSLYVVLRDIRAAVADTDAGAQVVELVSVQLEELDQ